MSDERSNQNRGSHNYNPSAGAGRAPRLRPSASPQAGAGAQPQAGAQSAPAGQAAPKGATRRAVPAGQPAARPGVTPGAAGAARQAGGSGGQGGKKGGSRFTPKQIKLGILFGALAVVLIVGLLLGIFLPGCLQRDPAALSGSLSIASSGPAPDSGYDHGANSIPLGEYAGTLLEETEDAGEDYVKDTLFLGDSNTERMLAYRNVTNVTMDNGIGIANMGIGSVTSLRCVRFSGLEDMTMPAAVAIMQPQRVVINFGTNNLGGDTDSFITQYKGAIEAIQKAYPYCEIIVASVFPITQNCTYGSHVTLPNIDKFNLALVEMAQELKLKFLNWSDALKNEKDGYCNPKYMLADGVHLNEYGMKEIFTYFRTHEYQHEDGRPQPLNPIPKRLPTPEGLFPKPESSAPTDSLPNSSSSAASSSAPPAVTTINVSVGGGLDGVCSASGAGSGAPGSTISISVNLVVAEGYAFTGWSVSSGSVVSWDGATLVFAIPAEQASDISITANFTPPAAPPASSEAPPAESSEAPQSTDGGDEGTP